MKPKKTAEAKQHESLQELLDKAWPVAQRKELLRKMKVEAAKGNKEAAALVKAYEDDIMKEKDA